MSRVFVLAHKRTVGSGAELAKAIGAKCVVPKFRPRGGFKSEDTLINWGVGSPPAFSKELYDKDVTVFNPFLNVRSAVNKRKSLDILQRENVSALRPITSPDLAVQTLLKYPPKTKMFARKILCGSQGDGIQVFKDVDSLMITNLSEYKLFTIGFPKNQEFRVHVINDKVVDYSQKKRMSSAKKEQNNIPEVDRDIRSHKRGWVYTKVNVERYVEIEQVAVAAVKALGLHFGAVDILAVVKKGVLEKWTVCEVNTAPSLSAESTLSAYVEALSK